MGNTATVMHERAQRKRRERDALHEKMAVEVEAAVAKVPLELRERIACATATELLELMRTGAASSEAVVSVYCARSSGIGHALGATAEEVYSQALVAARESDARRAAGALLGPLDGLPVSIKDHLLQAGTDSTAGLAAKTFKPSPEDGLLVKALRSLGAIPFVRSNIPQAMLVPESANAIWGAAVNPWSALRTPGGSSGGEGALIAARCSPVGIGSDIGGSIRIPSHFCGICGFKPTPQRFPHKGSVAPRPDCVDGQQHIIPTCGPLARCVDDLALIMRAYYRREVFDEEMTIPLQPFDEAMYAGTGAGPLRIGVLRDDNFFAPSAACSRALNESAEALREAGHVVVEFDPAAYGVSTYRAALLFYGILASDGNLRSFYDGLEGEALHPMYHSLAQIAAIPGWLRPAAGAVLNAQGLKRMADLSGITAGKSVYELWRLLAEKSKLTDAFLAAWRSERLDLIICPGMGLPALPHGGSRDLTPACSYTFLWNLLHTPAGTVPVTRVRPDEQRYECPAWQRDQFGNAAFPAMEGSAGLPVGVQVIGLPFRDELVLRGMKTLETALADARRRTHGGAAATGAEDDWDPIRGVPEAIIQRTLADIQRYPSVREGRLP